MTKLRIPDNVSLDSNAKKQLKMIESTHTYDSFVDTIQEYLDFVSESPTNLFEARQRGWRVEKLKASKKEQVYSIRIIQKDRFAYKIEKGKVIILCLLGHYKGTKYESIERPTNKNNHINNNISILAKNYIENLDKNLTFDNKHSRNKDFPKTKDSLKTYKEILTKISNPSTNDLLEKLINSKDRSTRNIARLLMVIKNDYYYIYKDLINDIYNNLEISNGELKYNGYQMDDICVISSIIYFKELFKNKAQINKGKKLLRNILSGNMDSYTEFYNLNAMLKAKAQTNNEPALLKAVDLLAKCYENNNKECSLDNMRKLIELTYIYNLDIMYTNGTSCYDLNNKTIYINELFFNDLIFLHEFGHSIYDFYGELSKKEKNTEIFNKAKQNIINNPNSKEILSNYQERIRTIIEIAGNEFINAIEAKYDSTENAIYCIKNYIDQLINESSIEEVFRVYNIPEDIQTATLNDIKNDCLDTYKLSSRILILIQNRFINDYYYSQKDFAVLDIISAIFEGTEVELKDGDIIDLEAGHSKEYYKNNPDYCLHEIMANINVLFVKNDTKTLEAIKELVGEEFYNYIVKEYNIGKITTKKESLEEEKNRYK